MPAKASGARCNFKCLGTPPYFFIPSIIPALSNNISVYFVDNRSCLQLAEIKSMIILVENAKQGTFIPPTDLRLEIERAKKRNANWSDPAFLNTFSAFLTLSKLQQNSRSVLNRGFWPWRQCYPGKRDDMYSNLLALPRSLSLAPCMVGGLLCFEGL